MFHILFLCTHNRCRSILCEVIANSFAEGVFRASSAGSEPAGAVHPMTLQQLERRVIPRWVFAVRAWRNSAVICPTSW